MLTYFKNLFNLTSSKSLVNNSKEVKIKAFEAKIDSLLESDAYQTIADMIDNGHELTFKQIKKFFLKFNETSQPINMNEWLILSNSIMKQDKINKTWIFTCVEVLMNTYRVSIFYDNEKKKDYELKQLDTQFLMSLTYIPFITQFINHNQNEFTTYFNYDSFIKLLESTKNITQYTAIRHPEPLLNLMKHLEINYYKNDKNNLIEEMKEIYGKNENQTIEEKVKKIHYKKSQENFDLTQLNSKLLNIYTKIQDHIETILNNHNKNSIYSVLMPDDKKQFENLTNRDLPEILAAFTALPQKFQILEHTQSIFEENLTLILNKLEKLTETYALNQIEKLEIKKQYLKNSH